MPGFSDTSETAIMSLIFNATAWADYAINHTTTPQTQVAVGLHTADPGDTGTMATSEANYTSYARITPNRVTGAGGWIVTAASGGAVCSVSPGANIDFPAGTGGASTVTFFSTGHTGAAASAQPILLAGSVTPSISCGNGITPSLTTATTLTLD